MPTTEERVERLETVFASFMERTEEALADIRASTAEIRASSLRTDALLLEMQRQADRDRQQADRDRQQAEKDRQQAEEDRHQAEKDRQQAQQERQQDREKAEKDRQQADKERRDFNKRLAELSDSMGTLVENMVAPNARRIASEIFLSDPVVLVAQRVRRVHPTDRGRMIEIDLLAAGEKHLMMVEAKWRLNPEKIREFVDKVNSVPQFMPEYAGYVLVPVVASVSIEESVITYLNRQKVYGVAMGDETMELVNRGQF